MLEAGTAVIHCIKTCCGQRRNGADGAGVTFFMGMGESVDMAMRCEACG